MTNSNCLEGVRCPQCAQENSLITATMTCDVTDDGSERLGDHYWDGDSFTHCPECEHEGALKDFTS
jgi:hypothetical protein